MKALVYIVVYILLISDYCQVAGKWKRQKDKIQNVSLKRKGKNPQIKVGYKTRTQPQSGKTLFKSKSDPKAVRRPVITRKEPVRTRKIPSGPTRTRKIP